MMKTLLAICLIFLAGCWQAKPPQKAEFYRGEDVYSSFCSDCHDNGRGGALQLTDSEGWALRSMQWTSLLEEHAIHGFLNMPPKGGRPELSDQDIKDALYYMTIKIKSLEN